MSGWPVIDGSCVSLTQGFQMHGKHKNLSTDLFYLSIHCIVHNMVVAHGLLASWSYFTLTFGADIVITYIIIP